MCDIKKISKDKNDIIQDIDKTLNISGARVFQIEKEIKDIGKRAEENIMRFSLLL